MGRRSSPFVLAFVVLALVACDPASPSPSTRTTSQPTTSTATDKPTRPDPLVPYSPAPSELVPRTSGFVMDTLTLPTADDGTMLVTVDSTAIGTGYVDTYRPMSVWVTLENPGEEPWTGVPGELATIADDLGNVFEPIASPVPADLHPDPERYEASNRNLMKPQTIAPGQVVQGVIVFHPTGGNRAITISLSLDGGDVTGEWATTMGPF